MASSEWTHFGWQGIEFEMPAEWSLGKIEGERKSGYLRIDGGDMPRIEAKWDAPRSANYDVSRELDRQIRELEKRSRKAKMDFQVKRDVKLVRLENRRWECAHWRSDSSAYCVLTRCDDCGRVVLLRLLYQEDEPGRDWARRIFESLSDHREDCRDYWDVFGLSLKVPSEFTLERSSLKTGEIRLQLQRGRELFEAVRVSLGEYQLRDASLDDWFEKFAKKELEPYRWSKSPCKVREHPGFAFDGPRRLAKRILTPWNACSLKSKVWYCKPSDKLYILRSHLRRQQAEFFEEVCTSVECH